MTDQIARTFTFVASDRERLRSLRVQDMAQRLVETRANAVCLRAPCLGMRVIDVLNGNKEFVDVSRVSTC